MEQIAVQFVSFHGHDVKEWDPEKPGDLEKMRAWFKEKLEAGFRAFAFSEEQEKGELIQRFDEAAEKIILIADRIKMVPPGTGG